MAELGGPTVNHGYDNDYHLQSETIADPGGGSDVENCTYDSAGNSAGTGATSEAVEVPGPVVG